MIDQALLKTYLADEGLTYSDEVILKLDRFAELLLERNQSVNLTAIQEPDAVLVKHLLDSLFIFKYVSFPEGAKVIDVGCGAGFPSMPMLIARNDLKMHFLDSTQKKLCFIEDTLATLQLNGTVIHTRAEEYAKKNVSRETFDFAVARAVANLSSLSELTLPLVTPGGYFIAMKGKEGEEELEQAKAAINILGGKTQALHTFTLPDGSSRTMIVVKKISQTPTKYPRTSAAILKKPLS